MSARQYSRDELMEHLKGAFENSRPSPMRTICAEAYDEIDKLFDAVEDAIETLEAMDMHVDNPLYERLRKAVHA